MITKSKTKKGIIKYAKIAHSYWDGKTSHQKILLNLGPIKSELDLEKFNKILISMKKGENFVKENDIKIMKTTEYGVTHTTNKLLEKYNLDNILKKQLSQNGAKFDVYSTIKALIINRLIKPSSDLSAYDWIKNDYSEKLDIRKHRIYRALDHLIKRKDEIEKQIFDILKEKLKLNVDSVHYDLTSSYFEGKKCEIAFYGHSRDHRKDRKQIVIGLVMCDGIPIHHEVYKGNTVDKSTLEEMAKNLREKLGIKDAVIIADGGLLTEDNLKDLEDNGQEYILGNPRRKNKMAEKYLIKEIISKENQSAKEAGLEKVRRDEKEYTRRYILCLNKDTKKERLETLETTKKNLEKKLEDLQKRYKKSQESKKGKKMTKESMFRQADKLLGKNRRMFELKIKENEIGISFKKEVYDYERKIAGKFLIVTNTDEKADKIMKSYKELQMVENAFDEIKNFLDVRPIEHHKERRVRAHVFVCVLSFLIESIIERFSDESARTTLRKLERIKLTKIDLGNKNKNQLTELSTEMINLFKMLKIHHPTILDTKNIK